MTHASGGLTTSPAPAETRPGTLRKDAGMLAYWISLGAAAGGLGGAVIGGLGGRLAMFVLRLTSDDSVRGIESDDGFIIGRFNLADTASLIVVTTVMGVITGLLVVAGRPFFPLRGMPFAWALAGACLGGSLFIRSDGVDFTVLDPLWLAVAMFIALPAAGALAVALLVDAYPRFWWHNRIATGLAAVAALPGVVFVPVPIATAVVAGAWLLALRFDALRNLHHWLPARLFAAAVFAAVVVVGAVNLVGDVREIL